MTPDITHLRSLLERATKGKWGFDVDTSGQIEIAPEQEGGDGKYLDWGKEIALVTSYKEDAELIVALVNAAHALLDEAEAGRRLRSALDFADRYSNGMFKHLHCDAWKSKVHELITEYDTRIRS